MSQPTRRQRVLNAIRFQAYHESTGMRAWFGEDRRLVSYEAYKTAVREGVRAKERGIACGCHECREAKEKGAEHG